VVGVSQAEGVDDLPLLICEFCGTEITEEEQQCPALEDGRCRP